MPRPHLTKAMTRRTLKTMTTTDKPVATRLLGRSLLALEGAETVNFLQGLVSNDTTRLAPDRALFAALLTPQGKFLHELIMARSGDSVLIDSEAARLADLQRRLTLYRLRAKIAIAPVTDGTVVAVLRKPKGRRIRSTVAGRSSSIRAWRRSACV